MQSIHSTKTITKTINQQKHYLFTGLTRWRGLGRPGALWAPPQDLLYFRQQRRLCRRCWRKRKAFGGHSPAKPPLNTPTA
jgi:hypothetical protein